MSIATSRLRAQAAVAGYCPEKYRQCGFKRQRPPAREFLSQKGPDISSELDRTLDCKRRDPGQGAARCVAVERQIRA